MDKGDLHMVQNGPKTHLWVVYNRFGGILAGSPPSFWGDLGAQKGQKEAQNGPKMAKNGPKMTEIV